MDKHIKNVSGGDKTYLGQLISNNTYYQIQPSEDSAWSNDSTLITDISSGDVLVAKDDTGNNDITDVNAAINYLKNNITQSVEIESETPFAAKQIKVNGVTKKLYKRVHGCNVSVPANSTANLDFVVNYAHAKFTGAEIFGTDLGDTVDFLILDDVNNTYSGAPGSYYTLNQFGFDVEMPQERYANTSDYDADLYANITIRCAYTNNTGSAKNISINVWLHEVKD